MEIDCYLSIGCASEDVLRENINQSLTLEAIDAEVTFYRITDYEAEELGLKGSPSILINGRDIQPMNMQGFS
ncbi:MAG: hypothetical protein RDU01_11295 [Thermodesulfovibrionales bacterium]|nr:hypothetical protein [Thermodesulfovibrionales bacterium]